MVQCLARGFLMRCAEKVDIKKVLPGLALQGARLDLGQVDVAQGKNAQGFEQCPRLVLQREHNGSLCLSIGHRAYLRNRQKAGVVLGVIFDTLFQDLHAVDLCGSTGGNRSRIARPRLLQHLYAPGCVVGRFRFHTQPAQVSRALTQRLWVTNNLFDICLLHIRHYDQTMLHAQKIFTGDMQVMTQEQVIVLVNTPRQ